MFDKDMQEVHEKPVTRNNVWLAERLNTIHQTYFPDVAIENKVIVRFGRKSRTRFGSIIAKKVSGEALPVTYITINSLFKHEVVPEFVIDATLIHEFVHYTHGFHSPRRQMHPHPHRGNIVTKEMIARGAEHFYTQQKQWIKDEYRSFLQEYLPVKRRKLW
jgi:hypothetical protein